MTEDSNPFAPFQAMFEQFDPGDAGSVPGMGMGLSPLALAGSGEQSPEDATKRAVKQLYATLDAMRGAETSSNLWQQYVEAMGIDPSAFGPEQVSAAAVRTYRIWFYSLTQILVETYSLRLVQEELVLDEHAKATGTQEWLWGLPQSDREQMLLRCTDVDDELVTEMQTLRKRRDELLYSFGDWDSVEFDESLADARRALDVLTALDERVTDGTAFSFVPDADDSAGEEQEQATEQTADDESSENPD